MESLQSSQLHKFLKSFESTHSTIIPQYLKYLLEYCDYSEFTIRFFNEDSIKGLETFIKNELAKNVPKEDWMRLTGGKFKDQTKFVFFPPVKLILLELAKFANNKNYRYLCKPEIFTSQLMENDSQYALSEGTSTNNKREYYSEEEGEVCELSNTPAVKKLKTDKSLLSQEGECFLRLSFCRQGYNIVSITEELRNKLRSWFLCNYKEDPPINVKVYSDNNNILTAKYVCHLCSSSIIFQNRDSRGWLRQNLYRHIRKHYDYEKQTFNFKMEFSND